MKDRLECDCGGVLEEKITSFDSIKIDATVCSKCDFVTLTKEQARRYLKLK